MSRRFKIERDCYEDENYLYKKGHVTFQPGLTVLVGCNGCGKTTLMKQLENILKKDRKKARVFRYENEIHGGHSSMQEAMFYGDMSFVAASVMSSEGEKIALNMQKATAKIGSLMEKSPDINEFWLLLDGVDSGFSIDAIEDLKRGLFNRQNLEEKTITKNKAGGIFMAIYVTGDTHGADKFGFHSVDGFVNRLNMESFPEQKFMTKEDYVIICGDFGGVWNYAGETPKEKHDLDWLDSRNFTTLFVPGNHENYDRLTGLEDKDVINAWMYAGMSDNDKKKILNGYPQKAWNGGMVREIRPSVLMLERGYVFNIDGCKCFAFGGARSHDISGGILKAEDFESKKLANKEAERWNLEGKTFRVNHVSWWEQEMPEQMEMERGWAMLEDEKYKVDFIFSHDCPASDKFFVLRENCPDELNKYLEQVKQKVDYKKWFFGHYHENMMIPGSKDLLLYEQLVQIN